MTGKAKREKAEVKKRSFVTEGLEKYAKKLKVELKILAATVATLEKTSSKRTKDGMMDLNGKAKSPKKKENKSKKYFNKILNIILRIS